MDVLFPHYLNDSEHLQIQCIFPRAEYESWAVRGLKHPVTDIADKAEDKGWPHAHWAGWANGMCLSLPQNYRQSSLCLHQSPEQHLTPLARCLVSHSGS